MQRVSLRIGRVPTALACKTLGVCMLVAIALLPQGRPWSPYAITPLYLLRTWLINCTSGLTKSVLNDYVPKRNGHGTRTATACLTNSRHASTWRRGALVLRSPETRRCLLRATGHRAKWNALESVNLFSWCAPHSRYIPVTARCVTVTQRSRDAQPLLVVRTPEVLGRTTQTIITID